MLGRKSIDALGLDEFNFVGGGYAPAHITGIFEIHNTAPDPLKCGSRGMGFCINQGVTSFVVVKKNGKKDVRVVLNGKENPGATTKATIKYLLDDLPGQIQVFSFTELPPSQGFGLSGAGALSTAIALNSALDLQLEYSTLIDAAHSAEVINQSGLGDVVAQATGGFVNRKLEGGFEQGVREKIELVGNDIELVICIIGQSLRTSKIISDREQVNRINRIGRKYLTELKRSLLPGKLSMEEFTQVSYNFANESRLIDKKVLKAIYQIHNNCEGYASMIMLGNALFAAGELEKIMQICQSFGKTIRCKIDAGKAKSIRVET